MQTERQDYSMVRGFTLIEVVVALGIFGLGVLALIHVQTENLIASSEIRDRVVADIIAENILVETYIEPAGTLSRFGGGNIRMIDQGWIWTREFTMTANPAITRLDVSVIREPDGTTLSTLTGFRGSQ